MIFRPAATAFDRYFAQGGFVPTAWHRLAGLFRDAQLNRLELAVQSEEHLDKITHPLVLVEERITLASRVFVDVFSGRHEHNLAITDVVTSDPSPTSVRISWKTNRSTNGKVNFGPSTMYGRDIFVNDLARDHAIDITGLTPNTKYFFEVLATDIEGKQTYDAYYSFTTPER
jgi:hypothetical protein